MAKRECCLRSRLLVPPKQRCRLTFTSVLTTDMFLILSRDSTTSRERSAQPAAARRRGRSRCQQLFTRARVFTPPTTAPAPGPTLGTEVLRTASRDQGQSPGPDRALSLAHPVPLLPLLPLLLLPLLLLPGASRQIAAAAAVAVAATVGVGNRKAVRATRTALAATPTSPCPGPDLTCAS